VTDRAVLNGVIQMFERKRKEHKHLFMYVETMQNHGPYNKIKNPSVYPVEGVEGYEASTFFTGLKKTDDTIKNVINYFKTVEEDVMVVFFGDHFPHIPKFTNKFLGSSLDKLPLETRVKLQSPPFFIWANYKIKEEDNQYFALSYLSSKVMEVVFKSLVHCLVIKLSLKEYLQN